MPPSAIRRLLAATNTPEMKWKFAKILLYCFLKYILFYLYLAIKNDNFFFFQVSNMSSFMYWWMFLFLPAVTFIIFSVPIYLLFRIRHSTAFISLLITLLVMEYFLYTYLASQADLMNGLWNEVISAVVFLVVFFKEVSHVLNKRPSSQYT